MTTHTVGFAHHVAPPGRVTLKTLAELLEVSDNDAISTKLRADLDDIRVAERSAERAAAEVRLY